MDIVQILQVVITKCIRWVGYVEHMGKRKF
jgi:hypothetical protein